MAIFHESVPQVRARDFDTAAYFAPYRGSLPPLADVRGCEDRLAGLDFQDEREQRGVRKYEALEGSRAGDVEEVERRGLRTEKYRDAWDCDFGGAECFCHTVAD